MREVAMLNCFQILYGYFVDKSEPALVSAFLIVLTVVLNDFG